MSNRGPRLVLLGKQGAGKGTQASQLAEHYDVVHLSTGELFRAAARERTPLGLEAQRHMDRGELVPDEIVLGVVRDELSGDTSSDSGFVLDGFPRSVNQAIELDRMLGSCPLDIVIDLDVPTEVVMRRIAGRRVCAQCGATYHVDNPPEYNWSCDVCGGHVVQRDDDTEDAVMRRLELYEIQTLPLIHFYRRSGKLARVDGTGDSEKVFRMLVQNVDSRYEPCRSP